MYVQNDETNKCKVIYCDRNGKYLQIYMYIMYMKIKHCVQLHIQLYIHVEIELLFQIGKLQSYNLNDFSIDI